MKSPRAGSVARKTPPMTIEVTTGDPDLAALADAINENHSKAVSSCESALNFVIAAGNGLNDAKRVVPHGEWLEWLEMNFEFSARTATTYMRLARSYPTLRGNEKGLADFDSIGKAVAALAKPLLRKQDDAERDGSAGDDRDEGQRAEEDQRREAENAEGTDAQADEGSGDAETDGTDATDAEAEEGTADGDADTQADEESSGQGDEQQEEKTEDDESDAAADRHRERCDRLRRIEAGSGLKPADKKLQADVQRGLPEFLGAVVELALQHGRRVCELAGGDLQLAAMLFVSLAKQAADPEKDFGPGQDPHVLDLDPAHAVPPPRGARSPRKPPRSSGHSYSDSESLG